MPGKSLIVSILRPKHSPHAIAHAEGKHARMLHVRAYTLPCNSG